MTPEPAEDSWAARFPGLTGDEVAERSGAETNRFVTHSTRSYLRIVIDNSFPAANVALVAVSAVLLALGRVVDALLTVGLIVGNIIVAVVQESRAKRQLDKIAVLTRSPARVVRDGREQDIDPDEIVTGDVLIIVPGAQVQADGSILAGKDCTVDESLLTGESDLVRKTSGDVVLSGSFCMGGRAVYRCDRVGGAGFANQISAKAREIRVMRTPLQREIGWVMWGMAVLVALIGTGVAASFHDIYGGIPLVESARAAAVIVGLIPQGLWAMVTVTYAVAVVRMAPLGTLVQRLNAIESMSHVDVLCFDKTGTITTNALLLEGTHALGLEDHELRRRLGTYCASAGASNRTNAAIANALGGEPITPLDEVAFDSSRKWSAMLFDSDDMQGLYVLGAPEVLAKHEQPNIGEEVVQSAAERGLRVLTFACQPGAKSIEFRGDVPQLPDGLAPLGLIMLRDELREGASETITRFAGMGIALKILSGDNPATVGALARGVGLESTEHAVSGLDINSDEDLDNAAARATVFGRLSPSQKEAIIAALQRHGHYVAMIGDGVNDVPALKQSQAAISMRTGSPVTRSVADIILLDDSFTALPTAFSEGRRIRGGMEQIIRLFLVRTISVSLMILGAAILSAEFPLTPRHTAILSTLTVGVPALFVAAWARPARTDTYLLPAATVFVLPAAVTLAFICLALYKVEIGRGGLDAARTVLTTVAILAGVLVITFVDDPRPRWMTLQGLMNPLRSALLAAAMLCCFAVAMAVPLLRRFYELELLDVRQWLFVAAGVAAWVLVMRPIWRLIDRSVAPRSPAESVPPAQ